MENPDRSYHCSQSAGPASPDGIAASMQVRLLAGGATRLSACDSAPDIGCGYSIDPYQGCEHGCIYCDSRQRHARMGYSASPDAETGIVHKPTAARLLQAELAAPGYRCMPIALGTTGDAYQPGERRSGITRAILEVLLAARHPVSVLTKSALILRDLDLWKELAAQGLGRVAISLSSLDGELARQLEPRASSSRARLETMQRLAAAGVPVAIVVAPLIPALNDQEMESLLAAGREHGATSASHAPLRLPEEVSENFRDWLRWHVSAKSSRIMALLYNLQPPRVAGTAALPGFERYARLIEQRFEEVCRRLDLKITAPALDCSRFFPPVADHDAAAAQLPLF